MLFQVKEHLLSKMPIFFVLVLFLVFVSSMWITPKKQTQAANSIVSSEYLDVNNDGLVDRIRWVMDETVVGCAYEGGDWEVNNPGDIHISIFNLQCTGTDSILDIMITADPDKTGGEVDPIISYFNNGVLNSVMLSSGALSPKLGVVAIDAASPMVDYHLPEEGAMEVSTVQDIVIHFTESMEIDWNYGEEFDLSFNPGDWEVMSYYNNTRVILRHAYFDPDITYTFSLDPSKVRASAGTNRLLNTMDVGDDKNSFSFRTANVGKAKSMALIQPTNPEILIDEEEGLTTSSLAVTLNLSVDNPYEMLISNNADFQGAEWQSFDDELRWKLESGISGERTVYAMFRTSTGSYSKVVSINIIYEKSQVDGDEPLVEFDTSIVTELTNEVMDSDFVQQLLENSREEGVAFEDGNNTSGGWQLPAGVFVGDLIKTAEHPVVYYVGTDFKRHVFPHWKIYFSWYNDYSGIKIIEADDIVRIPMGANVTMRPGTYLVKLRTMPYVYAVEPGGVLRRIKSVGVAKGIYGDDWQSRVKDIPDATFPDYALGDEIAEVLLPEGTLFKYSNQPDVFTVVDGFRRLFKSAYAFKSNNFDWRYIINSMGEIEYAEGEPIYDAETELIKIY